MGGGVPRAPPELPHPQPPLEEISVTQVGGGHPKTGRGGGTEGVLSPVGVLRGHPKTGRGHEEILSPLGGSWGDPKPMEGGLGGILSPVGALGVGVGAPQPHWGGHRGGILSSIGGAGEVVGGTRYFGGAGGSQGAVQPL